MKRPNYKRRTYDAGVTKLQWHSAFGSISVEEIQYRHGNQHIRPFVNRAQVRRRGCSRPLQAVATDFGVDVAFAQLEAKLVEHYGIILPESAIRQVTKSHTQNIHRSHRVLAELFRER